MNMLLAAAAFVFILNIPFGYWRRGCKTFSLQWFLAVHAPIPFIILIRLLLGLGFSLYTFPFLVGAYFLGQNIGGTLRKWRHRKKISETK